MPRDTLTDKQARFVDEYLVDLNATQAAIRAGYGAAGPAVRGAELVRNRKVRDAIAAARRAVATRTEITEDMVLEGLLKEAMFMDDGTFHAARISAWEKLGKHLGMFVERHDTTVRHLRAPEERVARISELAQRLGAGGVSDAPRRGTNGAGSGKLH